MIEAQPRSRRRIYRGNNTDEYIILFAAKFSQALFIVIDQSNCPRASVVTSFYGPRAPFPLSRLSSERPPIEIAALAVFQDRPGICQFVPFDHRPPPTDSLYLFFPPSSCPSFPVSGITLYGFVHPLPLPALAHLRFFIPAGFKFFLSLLPPRLDISSTFLYRASLFHLFIS